MLTTRYLRRAATVLLCALLLQNCQSRLHALEEEASTAEECIRRDTLSVLLDVAKSAPDKAAEFLEVLLVSAKDKHFRQDSLEALDKVARATPGRVSQCLSSLRAAAEDKDKDVRSLALKTLGEVEWKHYLGDVGPAPALPSNIGTILDSACPFWPAKKVRDTHLLVLIPATVEGAPFTLNLLGALIQHPNNGGHKTEYRHYDSDVKAQLGEKSPDRPYWLLMTREVLEGSRNRSYAVQRGLVEKFAKETQQPYKLPGVLEAATAVLLHHVRTGERLLGDEPWTYTRCRELVNGNPTVVGGFELAGLFVYHFYDYDLNHRGVAGCRRL
jgi:hypothetical protein